MSKILIVEDELSLIRFIKKGLEEEGYQIDVATDGHEALEKIKHGAFDLCLFDIMIPGMNGMLLLERVRQLDLDVPIIMLTARDDLNFKSESFNKGCDDYLTKPFEFDELLMRIQAILRRTIKPETKSIDPISLDKARHLLRVHTQEIALTKKEFQILECLSHNQGRPVEIQKILQFVWNSQDPQLKKRLEVHVNAIRLKVKQTGETKLLETVRGIGYQLKKVA